MTTTFGELNTGDMFLYAGKPFRKADPRTAVQQREDGGGDLHSVDAMVKLRPRTAVARIVEPETMTAGEQAAALLREAATAIAKALPLLDLRSRECKECGVIHYTNRIHGKTNKQLSGYAIQLRERATDLVDQANEARNQQTAHSAKEQ
jgi:hypothetical protein